jgi:hypothetical protein
MEGRASVRVTVVVLVLGLIAAGTAASSAAPRSGLGAKDASVSGVSNRTATVAVMPDIPPAGVRLATMTSDGEVTLDGQQVPRAALCEDPPRCFRINYLLLDRETLQRVDSGSVEADVAGMDNLGSIVDRYTGSLNYLVVLNWVSFVGELEPDRNALDELLRQIGAQHLTAVQRLRIGEGASDQNSPGSAVGVAGSPAGSAFVTTGFRCDESLGCNIARRGGLSGYLRLNGVTGKYDFVFTDPVDFDTQAHQTRTDDSPAQLTIKVGDTSYTKPNPGGGVSGFHLLELNAKTLQPILESVYATNAADGVQQPVAVEGLVRELTDAVDSRDRWLVFLQAFGAPHGNDNAWDQAAQQIERLGGTREVFDAMNAVVPRSLNGESASRKGPYAFVGRVSSTAPLAEASYSLNGVPGRLRGVLMRARDGGYEPMLAGPPLPNGQAPVNTELIQIANQAPQPFPAFTDANGRPIDPADAEAVQKFLGGPTVTRLCSATAPICEIRKSYYESYDSNWSSIEGDLTNAKAKCAQPHQGFTPAQCEGIRAELRDEVSEVAKVTQYFGPLGLQQPFGAVGVSALANINEIAQEIKDAVKPPPADNTTSSVLTVLSYLAGIAKTSLQTTPVAAVLSGAFSIGAYFTKADGSPDLIGPQVTTAASKLGVELADDYRQAGDHLDDLGKLIVSDYGKLTAVAGKVDAAPGPGEMDWRLGNLGRARDALIRAAKQTIYQRLVPLAYPYMYKLGGWANARDWWCYVPWPYPDRYLFRDQVDGAQFVGRYPEATTVAVGAKTIGSGGDAYVPGIPAPIADTLFKSADAGGLGLSKLEFYSPRNGFSYVSLDNLRQASGIAPFCAEVPDPPGNGH